MDDNPPRGAPRIFADLEDLRSPQGRRHDLRAMTVVAICAVICGASGWQDVAPYGTSREKWSGGASVGARPPRTSRV